MTSKLDDNKVYIVIDGVTHELEKPSTGYGKQTIHWQDGRPHRYEVNSTKKIMN